jgi:hypothetical protein
MWAISDARCLESFDIVGEGKGQSTLVLVTVADAQKSPDKSSLATLMTI